MAAKRVVAAFSSWFRAPDLGMTQFEVLSRASTFCVPSKNPAACGKRFHFLTAQHVTHPYLYPNFYPQEEYGWLYTIGEGNTEFRIEFRQNNGDIITSMTCEAQSFLHPSRDVVCVHLQDEEDFEDTLEELGIELKAHTLSGVEAPAGQHLDFHGHFLQPELDPVTKDDISLLLPREIPGYLLARSDRQTFCKTAELLEMGMCGGPVLLGEECVGIVEGIVPAPTMEEPAPGTPEHRRYQALSYVAGTAVYVESLDLRNFISGVEEQMVQKQEFSK